MPHDETRLSATRWKKSNVLFGIGVLLTFIVMLRVTTRQPVRYLNPHFDRLPPSDWPSLAKAAIVDLPITGFVERGAIRLFVAPSFHSPALRLIDLRTGGARFIDHTPDYVGPDFIEFYGIESGMRTGYVVGEGQFSDIVSLNVSRGQIVEATVEPTPNRPSRRIEFHIGGRLFEGSGTALCSFGEVELIQRVDSGVLVLHPPFDNPTRLVLSHDESPEGVRLGLRRVLTTGADFDAVSQSVGESSVHIATHSDVSPEARFALTAMPGTDALEGGGVTPSKNLLACLPESEFSTPPQIHTWTTGDPGKDSANIIGLCEGAYRVGVGLQRRGRYMIWRSINVAANARTPLVIESLEASMPGFGDEGLTFLPRWMQSFEVTPETSTGSRERRIHRWGPAEVWAVDDGLSRQIGWRDGRGQFLANSMSDPAMKELVNVSMHGPYRNATPWDAMRVSSALGFEIGSLGIDRLGLRSLPGGEYQILSLTSDSDASPVKQSSDFVEVVGQNDKTTVWGLVRPAPRKSATKPGGPKVVLINRSRQRSVHLTLPNAELRVALAPGEMRVLHLMRPTPLFVLSVLRIKNQPEPAAEESIGARLLGNDVMVIEYE